MTTQKQIDSAIKRTFKNLEKIAARKDKDGYNPYQGIFYNNSYFYVTDSICMIKVYYPSITIDNADNGVYYKVNVIEQLDKVRPLFNLEQDIKTEKMTHDHYNRDILIFDRFFEMNKPSNMIHIDPKRLSILLDIFAINKIIPSVTKDETKIKLFGSSDFCLMDAVLMGVRK